MGSLPAKPEKNPKESCNVIFSTASPNIELSDHEKEEDEIERLVFGTEFGEVERFVVVTAEAQIVKDSARKVEATNLQRAELKAEKQMFGSIVIQKEEENDHCASRGAGAIYWSERGQVAAVTWSDLVEGRSVPAQGPTSCRQLSRTGATKTERCGYIAQQIHEVRRKPERRPGARWRTRCEAGATHWSGLALPKRLVAKGVKIAIRLVILVCFSNIQPKRLDA
ncbi:hypothetical protein DY000_02031494 [Brassica cretica]|uniref:Uncharacterized protein n=1 Tax=Brassica cretica TaxID=69181 RepID=A0ABQ7DG55_BRACR|nr:hypothetical protein DY000_02031494 [Brassica cretica]